MAGERKILVARGGALGDFVLTLPVLAALRRAFPRAELHVLGYPSIASLAISGGLADAITPVESPLLAPFFVRDAVPPEAMIRFFADFDLIVSYLHDPNGIFQANVSRCAGARFVAGPHRPGSSVGLRATKALLRPLEALGIVDADSQPRLILPGTAVPVAHRLAIHPGSGSEKKNWPEAKWADFLQQLIKTKPWGRPLISADVKSPTPTPNPNLTPNPPCEILLISGEAEGARGRRLASLLPPDCVQLAQNLPLPELAQRLRSCAAFIGHDSGVTHLAAALGLPGLVLWGPSDELVWRPVSDKMRLLRHEGGLGELPVETVLREAELLNIG